MDSSSSTYTDPTTSAFTVRNDDSTSIGLAFSPALELRLLF